MAILVSFDNPWFNIYGTRSFHPLQGHQWHGLSSTRFLHIGECQFSRIDYRVHNALSPRCARCLSWHDCLAGEDWVMGTLQVAGLILNSWAAARFFTNPKRLGSSLSMGWNICLVLFYLLPWAFVWPIPLGLVSIFPLGLSQFKGFVLKACGLMLYHAFGPHLLFSPLGLSYLCI